MRHFGVSNFTPAQLDALASRVEAPLVTNQVEIHLLRLDAFLDGTLDQCQKLRIAPMGWSPLGGGRVLRGRGEGWEGGGGEAEERVQRALGELARAHHVEPEQIVYAWLLRHPARIVPVIGTNRLERITAAAQALSLKLETQEWFALWSAATGAPVP